MASHITKQSNILITGTTGLIGGEILRHLMRRDTGRIWPLIRQGESESIEYRLSNRLTRSGDDGEYPDHVVPLKGDILQPDWGMTGLDHYDVTSEVDLIIHNAADTSFAAHSDTATTNINGVQNLIAFAKKCKKNPLIVYMSTATNVGDVSGRCLKEDEGCQPDNHHFNDYTMSKAVAEKLLRESGLNVLTLRPTIVLSAGLPDARFARQILWCVPLTRVFRGLPLNPDARMDIVDVDYVAECAVKLMSSPHRQFDCYHLSAADESAVRIAELSEVVNRYYNRRHPLRLIQPENWTKSIHRELVQTNLRRKVFRSLKHYFPFFNMDVTYSSERVRTDLGSSMPKLKSPIDYLDSLLPLIPNKAALREAMVP